MQEHGNARTWECNDGTYPFNLFSCDAVLMGNLDVYHILYTQPIHASIGSLVSSHTAGSLSLSGEHTLGAPLAEHPLELVTVTTALCKT